MVASVAFASAGRRALPNIYDLVAFALIFAALILVGEGVRTGRGGAAGIGVGGGPSGDLLVTSLSSGMLRPSPSEQARLAHHRRGGSHSEAVVAEREERGWWSAQFRRAVGELELGERHGGRAMVQLGRQRTREVIDGRRALVLGRSNLGRSE